MFENNFLDKVKNILLEEKSKLLSLSNDKVVIDTEGDEIDEIQGIQLLELNKKLNIRNSIKLKQIEDALVKITKSTYGLCSDCEDEISEKRLLVNPHFLTCISCAEEREMESKQGKRV